jgi:hypothetical protein
MVKRRRLRKNRESDEEYKESEACGVVPMVKRRRLRKNHESDEEYTESEEDVPMVKLRRLRQKREVVTINRFIDAEAVCSDGEGDSEYEEETEQDREGIDTAEYSDDGETQAYFDAITRESEMTAEADRVRALASLDW